MQCPACKNVNLTMSDRQGVEIDYCPECRGVWLDRGELDKIIERSDTAPQRAGYDDRIARQHSSGAQDRGHYKERKREGFLGDLFDF
ncbi:MAG: zf-TFIIB domain-containing protein [Woeseiaceae bacterium]